MALNQADVVKPSSSLSITYGVGMALVFVGERIIGVGRPAGVASALGVAVVLAATAGRFARLRKAKGTAALPERALLVQYALGIAALLAYFLTSNVLYHLTGKTLEQRLPRVNAAFETLWPALWVLATLPVLFVEMSLASMARAPVLDVGRVRAARLSGLGIGFAIVFSFSLSYVASERDRKVDLSYFRVAKAGESTMKIVRAFDKPVQVTLFFPPANDVREEVEGYFADLTKESKFLQVTVYDHALAPKKARELGVSGNGVIVIGRDSVREQVGIPLQLERARGQLKALDQEVNKRLLQVTRPARIAYVTQGHEERSFEATNDTDKRGTIRGLKSLLIDQGFEVKDLGVAQGLAHEVPKDATVVLIIGPKKPFLEEEAQALETYVQNKGRVLMALDAEPGLDHANLLGNLGLKFNPTPLANDRVFWPRNRTPSDRLNIATASFGSHVSVTALSRLGARAPVIFMGAGALEKVEKGAIGIVNQNFTVHADSNTWPDANGNLEADSNESRNAHELAVAVNKRNASAILPEEEGRVVVFADSDAFTDAVLGNVGNAYLFVDAIRWLAGEERIAGQVNTEEDVAITHTRKQDIAWFYGTVFLAPVVVLGAGALVTRRRRRSRKRPGDGGGAAPNAAAPAPAKEEVSS